MSQVPQQSQAAKRAQRQKAGEAYRALSPQDRRRQRLEEKRKRVQAGAGQKKAPQGPVPNIPGNTIWDYYQPPPQYDFSDDGTAGNFNDPYNVYLSAVPVMQQQMTDQIGGAMAQAGFGGNRYSSDAMATAGKIGADTSMQMNQMFSNMLYNQTNQDLDRQMQAAQLNLQATPMAEDAMRHRLGYYSDALGQQIAAAERAKGRQMQMLGMRHRDFMQNRYGNLDWLSRFVSNDLGQTPSPIIRMNPGEEGAQSWMVPLMMMMSGAYGGGF